MKKSFLKFSNVLSSRGPLKILLYAIILLLFFAVSWGLGYAADDSVRHELQDLSEMVEELNEPLPLKIDEFTTILSVSLDGDKTFIFDYEIPDTDYSKLEVKITDRDRLASMMVYYCFDEKADVFKSKSLTIINRYKNENGAFLDQYVLDTTKCTEEWLNNFIRHYEGMKFPVQVHQKARLVKLEKPSDRELLWSIQFSPEIVDNPTVKKKLIEHGSDLIRKQFCYGEKGYFQKTEAKMIHRFEDEQGNFLAEYTLEPSECPK